MQLIYDGRLIAAYTEAINLELAVAMLKTAGIADPDMHLISIEPSTTNEIKEQRKKAQLIGIEFNGVMCSATAEDQNGLSALLLKHALAKMTAQQLPDIHFRFENGNVLTLNSNNIEGLDAVWTPFRLSFFPPAEIQPDATLAP